PKTSPSSKPKSKKHSPRTFTSIPPTPQPAQPSNSGSSPPTPSKTANSRPLHPPLCRALRRPLCPPPIPPSRTLDTPHPPSIPHPHSPLPALGHPVPPPRFTTRRRPRHSPLCLHRFRPHSRQILHAPSNPLDP